MIFHFTPAAEGDIPELMALVRQNAALPYSHWDEEYPAAENLEYDIRLGALYRIEDENGTLAGMISMGPPQETDELCWPVETGPVCELSRLALTPALHGQGLGTEAFRQALAYAEGLGYRSFRLLVVTDFSRGIRIYEKLGFARVGEATMWELPYYLYQKIL